MISETPLLLAWAHHPVAVLGFGQRIGIWFQGCSIQCKGCVSKDTWAFDAAKLTTVEQVFGWVRSLPPESVDGLTISGGEPFDQPEALAVFIRLTRDWFDRLSEKDGAQRDILCYSGYPLQRLTKVNASHLAQLDVLICEPFIEKSSTVNLAGSANQRVERLTALAHKRYPVADFTKPPAKSLQLAVDASHRMWAIGIPQRGDLERVRCEMVERGLVFDQASWLA